MACRQAGASGHGGHVHSQSAAGGEGAGGECAGGEGALNFRLEKVGTLWCLRTAHCVWVCCRTATGPCRGAGR